MGKEGKTAEVLKSPLGPMSAGGVKISNVNVHERKFPVPEAAAILGIAPKTLWTWIGERKIAVYRIGRSVRVGESAISGVLESGFTPARRVA